MNTVVDYEAMAGEKLHASEERMRHAVDDWLSRGLVLYSDLRTRSTRTMRTSEVQAVPCRCRAYPFPHRTGSGDCGAPRYVCDRCREGFEAPEVGMLRRASWGWDGGSPAEYEGRCPACGAPDYTERRER